MRTYTVLGNQWERKPGARALVPLAPDLVLCVQARFPIPLSPVGPDEDAYEMKQKGG